MLCKHQHQTADAQDQDGQESLPVESGWLTGSGYLSKNSARGSIVLASTYAFLQLLSSLCTCPQGRMGLHPVDTASRFQ